jgi:Transposase DDE domain
MARNKNKELSAALFKKIALGREGKVLAKPRDAKRYPHTVAMAAKFDTEQGKADYRKRKWIAEPPNGWIKNVLGFRRMALTLATPPPAPRVSG